MAEAPLHGLRILAVEQFGAGPFGTVHLADLGAEVIRLEDPSTGGDVSRYMTPGQQGTDSLYFDSFNRGKRNMLLDLKNPAGQEVLHRLVRHAHAVYANLRGDVVKALGLTYAALGSINPAIVCVSLSAYGREGDRSNEPGYDPLIQAEAGWAALTGDPDGPPVKSGLSLADYSAGMMAGLALMAAVFDAQRTGRGRDVDVSFYDVALAFHNYRATWYLTAGLPGERTPGSSHPTIVPFQFFRTADGYRAVACAKKSSFARWSSASEFRSWPASRGLRPSTRGAATARRWSRSSRINCGSSRRSAGSPCCAVASPWRLFARWKRRSTGASSSTGRCSPPTNIRHWAT